MTYFVFISSVLLLFLHWGNSQYSQISSINCHWCTPVTKNRNCTEVGTNVTLANYPVFNSSEVTLICYSSFLDYDYSLPTDTGKEYTGVYRGNAVKEKIITDFCSLFRQEHSSMNVTMVSCAECDKNDCNTEGEVINWGNEQESDLFTSSILCHGCTPLHGNCSELGSNATLINITVSSDVGHFILSCYSSFLDYEYSIQPGTGRENTGVYRGFGVTQEGSTDVCSMQRKQLSAFNVKMISCAECDEDACNTHRFNAEGQIIDGDNEQEPGLIILSIICYRCTPLTENVNCTEKGNLVNLTVISETEITVSCYSAFLDYDYALESGTGRENTGVYRGYAIKQEGITDFCSLRRQELLPMNVTMVSCAECDEHYCNTDRFNAEGQIVEEGNEEESEIMFSKICHGCTPLTQNVNCSEIRTNGTLVNYTITSQSEVIVSCYSAFLDYDYALTGTGRENTGVYRGYALKQEAVTDFCSLRRQELLPMNVTMVSCAECDEDGCNTHRFNAEGQIIYAGSMVHSLSSMLLLVVFSNVILVT